MRYPKAALLALFTLVLVGCTSTSEPSPDPSTTPDSSTTSAASAPVTAPSSGGPGGSSTVETTAAPSPGTGTATLTIGDTKTELSIQLCVESGAKAINITAVDPSDANHRLIANLADPVAASTLVYTVIAADNSFTTYSMGSANSGDGTAGSQSGNTITLSGQATVQELDATGQPSADPTTEAISLDASCRSIQSQQSPVSFAERSGTTTATTTG